MTNETPKQNEISRDKNVWDLNDFAMIVDEHQKAIRSFVAARIDDPFEAQDLSQEVFLVAYRKLDEFDPSRPLRPWLYGIASNLVKNHRRKLRDATLHEAGEVLRLLDAEIESLDVRWQNDTIFEALEKCLARLESDARRLLRLRYEDGLEIAEIRAAVGGRHSTITMRLHRLRERLRECIELRLGEASHG